MPEIPNYEQLVYAGVLGKVIGVYMGRPFEGWGKPRLLQRWGLVDRYVASDLGLPLVVADDDISGTFTFLRALEDSGLYADTPADFFGKTWLNYLIENKTILWWGGRGVSTEHTAYLNLKQGIPSPQSGGAAVNGTIVSEQIGAQIFIDAFGLVAPGDPQLAARLARPAAQVAHDGEAVNAALVVAALVSAAFVEKDMNALLDIGVSVIPPDCLIAQLHRDVRAWRAEDDDWQRTYDRIAAKYGYDTYGGGCHVVPNHAIMVMAWSYAPDSFRRSQAIINTAGWDTDCNAANVGSVMGVKLGLDRIDDEYDFRSPFADRMLLPTAEGTRHISDCLQEALHIARIGRKIMGWPGLTPPKNGAWHHFALPGSRHGYMPEAAESQSPGQVEIGNVVGPTGARMLEITFRDLTLDRPLRVSTPVLAEPRDKGYAVMGSPRLYPGQTVTLRGHASAAAGQTSLRLFLRHFTAEPGTHVGDSTALAQSDSVSLGTEKPFTLSMRVPDARGFPVKDLGLEIQGDAGASGRVLVDSVTYDGAPRLLIEDECPRTSSGALLGWVADLDTLKGAFSHDTQPMTYYGKNSGRGVLVTGADDWTDYTISSRFTVHCAEEAGLIARYQGLQRFIALVKTRTTMKLVLNHYGDRTLGEVPCTWKAGELHTLSLTVKGTAVTATLDGKQILRGSDEVLRSGGAGYLVDRGLAGFRQTAIAPA